jgi:hypothetical protein
MVTAHLQEIAPAIILNGMELIVRLLFVINPVKTMVTAQLRVHARATILYGMEPFVTYLFVIHPV